MVKVNSLVDSISLHCWSPDRSLIAICPNNNEIWVYETLGELDSAKWKRRDVIHAVFLPFACSLYYVAHYENHWPGLVSKQ